MTFLIRVIKEHCPTIKSNYRKSQFTLTSIKVFHILCYVIKTIYLFVPKFSKLFKWYLKIFSELPLEIIYQGYYTTISMSINGAVQNAHIFKLTPKEVASELPPLLVYTYTFFWFILTLTMIKLCSGSDLGGSNCG